MKLCTMKTVNIKYKIFMKTKAMYIHKLEPKLNDKEECISEKQNFCVNNNPQELSIG